MSLIEIPTNFSGVKFKEIYGDYPVYDIPGYITIDDSITDLNNCIDNQAPIDQAVAILWTSVNDFVQSEFDSNSMASLLWYKTLSPGPSASAMIDANVNWFQGVWANYANLKAEISSGGSATFDPSVVGNCPNSIWTISQTIQNNQ